MAPWRLAARQILRRGRQRARGLVNTHVARSSRAYDPGTFWDESFYTDGVSDAQTIRRDQGAYPARFHYAALEALILRVLHNERLSLEGRKLLDVGSGAGHWLAFYRSLGAGPCDGVDVSRKCVDAMRARFAGEPAIRVHEGLFDEFLAANPEARYGVVNAVGVMFHVVDDDAWERGLGLIAERLDPSGLLLVSDAFGWITVDVQQRADGTFNKRLRSRRRWRRALASHGFRDVRFHRNFAWLSIDHTIPESSLLLAIR